MEGWHYLLNATCVPEEGQPDQRCAVCSRNQIANEPAFDQWVTEVLKRSKHLIAKGRDIRRCTSVSYKYGIQLPNNYAHALHFDEDNGNDLWQKAIKKE